MPAPIRSKVLRKNEFSPTFKSLKPTVFPDPGKPTTTTGAPSIRTVGWSPLGNALASATASTIRIWNPENTNSRHSQELRAHSGLVERVVWNPSHEALLASTGTDGTVKLWDVRTGSSSSTSASSGAGPGAATGQSASTKSSVVQDTKIGDSGGLFMTFNPSGTELLIGRRDDVLVPIELRMQRPQPFSDGLANSTTSGPATALDTLYARPGHKISTTAQTNQMCFSNSGREVFATMGDGTVRILDWPSLTPLHALHAHTSAALSVAYSPRGTYLAAGGADSLITLWDTYDWVCRRTLAACVGAMHSLSFSFDGTYICGAHGTDRDALPGIEIAHVESGEYVHTVDTVAPASVVAWHPLRYVLAYAGDTGGLKVLGLSGNT